MPANLSPDYRAAEERFRQARSVEDKIAGLEEMLRLIPKHKGTDHLQADIKSRIKDLSEELAGPGKGKTVVPAKDWQTFELPGDQVFINRQEFAASLAESGQLELRNVRVLTPDKTEMMRYTFY